MTGVEVDLSTGAVSVTSEQPLDANLARDAVAEAGYDLAESR